MTADGQSWFFLFFFKGKQLIIRGLGPLTHKGFVLTSHRYGAGISAYWKMLVFSEFHEGRIGHRCLCVPVSWCETASFINTCSKINHIHEEYYFFYEPVNSMCPLVRVEEELFWMCEPLLRSLWLPASLFVKTAKFVTAKRCLWITTSRFEVAPAGVEIRAKMWQTSWCRITICKSQEVPIKKSQLSKIKWTPKLHVIKPSPPITPGPSH